MAVWHFKFSLVPTQGIIAEHGSLVTKLPEYGSTPGRETLQEIEDAEYSNYWRKAGLSPAALTRLTQLLPPMPSWVPDAKMFGEEEGNRIELWEDDINCMLDLRTFSKELLQAIVETASDAQCKLVLHGSGTVIEPDMQVVLERIVASDAYAFCAEPMKFLREKGR